MKKMVTGDNWQLHVDKTMRAGCRALRNMPQKDIKPFMKSYTELITLIITNRFSEQLFSAFRQGLRGEGLEKPKGTEQ
jgi:hypothetical protein